MSDQVYAPRTRRRLLAETLSVATATLLGHGGMMGGPALAQSSAQEPAPPPTPSWPKAAFPLRIPAGKRYLEDAAGQPFLIHGDSAWSLIAQLTRDDAATYLQDRQARGFNAILVNLIEHRFSSHPPANAYGGQPFLTPGDFATPNDDYFAHADWVLRQAAECGILVLLAPAYLGYRGGGDGWYREMVANGPAKLRAYGQYLGRRYGGFTNILWVHGGDYDPPHKEVVRAIAEGIRDVAPNALSTAHCGPETSPLDYWHGEPWLQLNNVYTYNQVYIPAIEQHARPERMPFFLIESKYEGEEGISDEQRMRAQAYHALLAGACGHLFGNNPIWRFDGPAIHPAPFKWREALGSRGGRSMSHLRALFLKLPWWTLEPDDGRMLTAGSQGTANDRAVAARSADRSIALVYLPTVRSISISLGELAAVGATAQWYDPANGRYVPATESPLQASRTHAFCPVAKNSAGYGDWVLVLQASRDRI
jgi:hypothetical protein